MPGYFIKKRREELGFSQEYVSQQLFMSQSTYSRIENKQVALTVETGKRIAAVLMCHLDDLLPNEVVLENGNESPDERRMSKLIDEVVQKHMKELKTWLQQEFFKPNP